MKLQQNYYDVIPMISLIILIASFGIAFIGMGISGLLHILVRAVVRACTSFTTWILGQLIDMACNKWFWTIGVVIASSIWIMWTRNRKIVDEEEEDENVDTTAITTSSSISVVLPWIVAITSPSNIETLIIILSLMSFLSVLIPGSTVFVVFVALLVTVMNIVVISTAATKLEEHDHEKCNSKSGDDEVMANSVVGGSLLVDNLDANNTVIPTSVCNETGVNRKRILMTYTYIQQHICDCHIISIATLAIMSTFLILVQAIYSYLQNEGINIIFTFGKVSCHVLYMGIGILMLHELWNSTIFVVTGNHISWGEVTRIALKQSIIEISSNTVWRKEDIGSSLLGILSDDYGALRYAILEGHRSLDDTAKTD